MSASRLSSLLATLLLVAPLAGCFEEPPGAETRGVARLALFDKCMKLAAEIPRQSDDKVSEIVDSCSLQAYYMTNYIR